MCPSETTRPLSVCQSELVVPVTEDPPPPRPTVLNTQVLG